jgi:hypothetical protein
MARRVFFSFHFDADSWRASQVRNAGVVEGDEPVSSNDWEAVKRGGDDAIKRWINGQMSGKSCLVVLIGAATAGRKWIKYEIGHAWNEGKGVVGVHIHNLKDAQQFQSRIGADPFAAFSMDRDGASMSTIVERFNPNSAESTVVYSTIKSYLAEWVERAVKIRNDY